MLQNEEIIRVGIEGVPGVGKSTLWNLLGGGKFIQKRTRSSQIKELKLSPKKIQTLFTKKIPETFFGERTVILTDLPGHTIFDLPKENLRKSFSAGILMINLNKISLTDYTLVNWYFENNVPLFILVNTYEKVDEKIEQKLALFPEYILPFTGSLELLSFIQWSSKINKNWSKLLYFLYKTVPYKEIEIKPEPVVKKLNSRILYITAIPEREHALQKAIDRTDILKDTLIRKEILRNNDIRLILVEKKITLKEKELIKQESPSAIVIREPDFFRLVEKTLEKLGEDKKIKSNKINVFEIIKRFSEKKSGSLIGLKVILGQLNINNRIFSRCKTYTGNIISMEIEGVIKETALKGNIVGVLAKGSTKDSPCYLFGDFIISKKIEGNYTEEELYWLKYCGKEVKD